MISTLQQRFEGKVVPAPDESGCILWAAYTRPDGYGEVYFEGRARLAHRVAWLLEHGHWPKEHLLHHCDTPSCVNVEHLFEGSNADNVADCVAKGRNARGERNGHAKLTDHQVSEIRRRLAGAPRGMVSQLAWEYGVSQPTISMIKHGQRHATPLPDPCSLVPGSFPVWLEIA